jgi:hypothetical protein
MNRTLKLVDDLFHHSLKKEWYKTYWAIDIHGTILKPNHSRDDVSMEFYEDAKESLQILSKRDDIVLILFTSAYPDQITKYLKFFEDNDIHFNYVNENPEIDSSKGNFGYYEDKFYYNILFDDRAGFAPEEDWMLLCQALDIYERINFLPKKEWTTKY